MRHDLIAGIAMICVVLGCRDNVRRTGSEIATFPGLTVRTERTAAVAGVDEVTFRTAPRDELICRVITQGGRVVSVLPTPIGSDDLHSYAEFRPLGNGWHPISFMDLDELGRLSIGGRGDSVLDERRMQNLMSSQEQVYLVVEQNAPYSNLLGVVQQLAIRTSGVFGVGWRARYPDLEDVGDEDQTGIANKMPEDTARKLADPQH